MSLRWIKYSRVPWTKVSNWLWLGVEDVPLSYRGASCLYTARYAVKSEARSGRNIRRSEENPMRFLWEGLVVDTWTDTERGIDEIVDAIVVCERVWFIVRVGENKVGLVKYVKNGGVGAKMVDVRWYIGGRWKLLGWKWCLKE